MFKTLGNALKNKEISNADLTDSGICPTCFDRENNNVLYGDNKDKVINWDKVAFIEVRTINVDIL